MRNITKSLPSIEQGSKWIARDRRRQTGMVEIKSVIIDTVPEVVSYTRGGASRKYYTLLRNWHHRFKPATE